MVGRWKENASRLAAAGTAAHLGAVTFGPTCHQPLNAWVDVPKGRYGFSPTVRVNGKFW
jgi:hypothetical protein